MPPKVDTSAEKLLALAGRVQNYLNRQGGIQLPALLQDCEAVLRALTIPVEDKEVETACRAMDDEGFGPEADLFRRLYRQLESFRADGYAHKARLAILRRQEDAIRDLTAECDRLSARLQETSF